MQHRQALIPGTYTISSYGARLASLPSCEPATAGLTNTVHEWVGSTTINANTEKSN
ncbi:uncharacterized protein K452DRAFT_97443 [Aplosporella prunicola CBS 121167]|uniref:Uncharacterized protein n=1 Tax=Aplosporella prunicola CBS 121167 TaxID=1176127 RepID=A0A6A6ASZ5_9PEZI|nr:uncharacterized protein K452DRAFT_97443 [Aplosporella prunicola CBS 121167]KAF2135079.1 hypothetical protein K452DRAFT_97443 [Aplosporella prunicola CBS 121167]